MSINSDERPHNRYTSEAGPHHIVIIGASFAGIGAAHYTLRWVLRDLPGRDSGETRYKVILINPSEHYFWRPAAPRAIVAPHLLDWDKLFYPIEPAFVYAHPEEFEFIEGLVTGVDPAGRTVSILGPSGEELERDYAALVIATGVSTPCDLFTQDSSALSLKAKWKEFQDVIWRAKNVVIAGGGPLGVECAGEIAEARNGKLYPWRDDHWRPKCKVTIVTRNTKILPKMRDAISQTACKELKRLACKVIHEGEWLETKVDAVYKHQLTVLWRNHPAKPETNFAYTLGAEAFIDATGAFPNTQFLPDDWLDDKRQVACHRETLRVDSEVAGPRVYCVGDVGNYSSGGILDLKQAIPVAMANMKTDLVEYMTGVRRWPDKQYKPNLAENQIVPIGTRQGVGAFNGWRLPSTLCSLIKGRDYLTGMMAKKILNGYDFKKDPDGSKYSK
ncbi:FAD/NAD(P)-binding domain-containing protein [Sporormia fimetaria CBS 119925]|uniref:FAD/NAD(P)-binding domain-containing protein n=1 Tax=Sporormia fimetaria CBS 119925 TaxID=1340428 RepID=A0A6A6VJ35_9PLEO|nr:FAD/NAD(P)-binding domain-containing protein [Sporormia fimetaria CBS 119925]